jgi:hypothetical protein
MSVIPLPIGFHVLPLFIEYFSLKLTASGGAAHWIVQVDPEDRVSPPFGYVTVTAFAGDT